MATHVQSTGSLPESIRCYLLRGNAMVPLVPADQLPFQLKGIPRQLSHRQMSDQGWKLFKETTEAPSLLSIQVPTTNDGPSHSHCNPEKPHYLAPDHHVRAESQTPHPTPHAAGRPCQSSLPAADTTSESLGTPSAAVVDRQLSLTDAVASVYHNDAERLGYIAATGPTPPKKVYCTHWIATGECRWMHTGCRYKHEMPGTEKLRELGFTRGTPKWWRERNAVAPPKPLTWMQRNMARIDNGEQQGGEMPAPRAFPDPLVLRTRKIEEQNSGMEKETRSWNAGFQEDQPTASTPNLPIASSTKSLPVRRSTQPLNLIDLDDTPTLNSSRPCSPISSAENSEPSTHSIPPPSPPHPLSPHRTRLPSPISSTASSSSSPSSTEPSDTEAPTPLSRRTPHHHRKTSSVLTTTTAVSPAAQPPRLGLASSKHAVEPLVSAPAAPREMQMEMGRRRALKKGVKMARSV